MVSKYRTGGWFKEPRRHGLAAKGIKTGRKINYMFSLETIKRMNREQAKIAKGKMPLTYTGIPQDLRRIPNFGDYRPKGWKLGEVYFVDNSGLGQPGEPALTFKRFVQKAKKGRGYAIIETGQFQIKIGEFEKLNDIKTNYAKKDKLGDKVTSGNLVNYIMQYEGGNMTMKEFFSFFGHLIKTGQVWHLQGRYGREAARLIDDSLISKDGKVNWKEIERRKIDLDSNLYEE